MTGGPRTAWLNRRYWDVSQSLDSRCTVVVCPSNFHVTAQSPLILPGPSFLAIHYGVAMESSEQFSCQGLQAAVDVYTHFKITSQRLREALVRHVGIRNSKVLTCTAKATQARRIWEACGIAFLASESRSSSCYLPYIWSPTVHYSWQIGR